MVSKSPLLQQATKTIQADWLLKLVDQIDVVKAETEVKRLQQRYPHESASQIAQHIITEKALFAGASGLASSVAPGAAAAMLTVDLLATTALQAEMVYQIACAYGLDLRDPVRKGEVLAVFGLSFGGNYAVKTGLGLLRNIPLAGAVIGASSNAVMIYTLGYATCHFYEARLNPNPSKFEQQVEDIKTESEKRLKNVIPQQEILDQILVHVVLAGNQGKEKASILADLTAANLSPEFIAAISSYIDAPIPLEILLNNVNQDFALSLLTQCQKIANLDSVVTSEESQVLGTIQQKLLDKQIVS